MAVFTGTYVPINAHSNARINYIVDNMLTPKLIPFRQVTVYDEPAVLQADGETWKTTYGNWNDTFPFVFRKNKAKIDTNTEVFNINYLMGTYELGPVIAGDNSNITYNFDYFGVAVLAGFILQSIDTINTAAFGSSTHYTIDNAPDNWDGVLADLAFAQCMEKLILDYDLWYGRLIFAIGAQQLEEGGGDVVSTFETLKQNAEERAYKTLENERFKNPCTVSLPTQFYYQGIRGFGRGSAHNVRWHGKFRGYRPSKYL